MLELVMAAAVAGFQPAPCALENVPAGYEDKHGIQCGWVTVPRSAETSEDRTLLLWIARIRGAGSEPRAEPVLYINGGPGIATIDSILPYLAESKTMALLGEGRELILFDQRGTGRSEEKLCPELLDTLNSISAEALEAGEEEARQRAEFAKCRASIEARGLDLAAYTTTATVHDIEHIRRALGVKRWNLAAISYGTLVALDAMRTYPVTIRSVVLNSPYPPNSAAWAEQATSAAGGFAAIDRACGSHPTCRERFGALMPKLEQVLARLEREPLADGDKRVTGRQFLGAIWPLAVRSSTVKFVPLAIHRVHAGDEALIRSLVATYAGGGSFGGFSPAMARAVACYEAGVTAPWYARARSLHPAMVSGAPDDSWDRLCAGFRPGYAPAAFFAPVASNIPTLIYAGSLDPATPSIDAYQTGRLLTRATIVEVPGAAHGPIGVDECTMAIAGEFLEKPETPPSVDCMAQRTPIEFATEGLDDLLKPPSK